MNGGKLIVRDDIEVRDCDVFVEVKCRGYGIRS